MCDGRGPEMGPASDQVPLCVLSVAVLAPWRFDAAFFAQFLGGREGSLCTGVLTIQGVLFPPAAPVSTEITSFGDNVGAAI